MSSTKPTIKKMDPLQEEIVGESWDAAKSIWDQVFEGYDKDLVAAPSDLTTEALKGYAGLDMGTAEYQAALDKMYGIAEITPEQRAAKIGDYATSYTDAILDPTLNTLRRERAKQRVEDASEITKSKAFGNIRRGVFEGEREGEYEALMGKTEADIRADAIREAEARYARELGMDLTTAQAMGAAAQTKMQSQLAGLGAQMTAGEAERALKQAELDAQFAEFMREQNFPLQQFQALVQILGGTPTGYGTTTEKDPFGGLRAFGNVLSGAGSFGQGGGLLGMWDGPTP